MSTPEFFNTAKRMISEAFPDGISEEHYWALLYLLYDHMSDENLVIVMAEVVDRPAPIIANDVYKVRQLRLEKDTIREVRDRLNARGFEEWKKESES